MSEVEGNAAIEPSSDVGGGAETASSAPKSSFSIPSEYSEEKWAQNITSLEGLFKEHANLQKFIGAKPPAIPGQDAGDDEWNSYFDNLRPGESKDYSFTLDDILGSNIPEESKNQVYQALDPYKEFMYEAGLSPKQADKLIQRVLAKEIEDEGLGKSLTAPIKSLAEKQSLAANQEDQEFKNGLKNAYGDKAPEAVKIATDFISNQPDEIKVAFEEMTNTQALALVKILYDQHSHYNTSDKAVINGSSVSSMRPEQALDRISDINIKMMKMNPLSSEFKQLTQERNNLRKTLR